MRPRAPPEPASNYSPPCDSTDLILTEETKIRKKTTRCEILEEGKPEDARIHRGIGSRRARQEEGRETEEALKGLREGGAEIPFVVAAAIDNKKILALLRFYAFIVRK
ncbi:hypothetical protein GW17_00002040 [Ensete ventricosum]|nr:hypothetical protein GW17_00002040 [Ensete ventricosum]